MQSVQFCVNSMSDEVCNSDQVLVFMVQNSSSTVYVPLSLLEEGHHQYVSLRHSYSAQIFNMFLFLTAKSHETTKCP